MTAAKASPELLVGHMPAGGVLFAAIAPTHHVKPEVADGRLLARLRPFPGEAEARTALDVAGAERVEVAA
jgi:hypothetical protein